MSAEAQIKAPAIPEDILITAASAVMEMQWFNKPTAEYDHALGLVARAILAERERCALVAEFYSETSLHAEWTEDGRGAAYYACSDVANAIRNPASPLPNPSADLGDDLPF